MKLNRVAITGMGALCGLGHNLEDVWKNLIEGKSGISTIENYDVSTLAIQIAGEVKDFKISEEILNHRDCARYDRFTHFAMHSAEEAIKNSGLLEDTTTDRSKIGCLLGVGMGGFPMIENSYQDFSGKGARRISPFFIPGIIPNMPAGLISIRHGLKGVNFSIASACASSAHALSMSCFEIMMGRQTAMISGGAEAVLSNLPIGGFINMKALSKRIDTPQLASCPFDSARDGFVIGEGAGILVLENLEMAKARGAHIIAEVVGHGYGSDAHHITAPHPEGEGAGNCMSMALESAGLQKEDIDYVNAHGTSTPLGDIAETKAIKKTLGKHAYDINVSSSKSMTGHLLGAAGGLETIVCAQAMATSTIPPTINLNNQDEACDLNYTANKAVKKDIQYALNNSFGFGGTNSSLILKKYS